MLLHREGIEVNHERAYRIYTEEDSKVRRKRNKIRSRVRTAPLAVPNRSNDRWSMDFISDNGSEFTGRILDAWANRKGIRLHFIDPGRPMQNAYIESFNGKFRDELLDQNWFTDLPDAKAKIESCRPSSPTGSRRKNQAKIPSSSWSKTGGGSLIARGAGDNLVRKSSKNNACGWKPGVVH